MPIYEYLCSACGVKKEHLQKISDARLTVCPDCGKPTYEKQLTAAGFQLKGSGWYVTDFKGGGAKPATAVATESKVEDASKPAAKTEGAAKTESAAPAKSESAAAPAASPAASTPSSSST